MLDLVSVARFEASADEPPIEIYEGDIERRFENVTETDPRDPGSQRILVYLRRGVLAGHRFWWLLEDVQPQFEVLNDAGIVVYQTANFAAPRLSPVARGDIVAVTGISPDENWYRIRSRRGAGWVPALILEDGLVRFIGDMDDVPTVVPPALNQANNEPATPDVAPTQDPNGNNNNGNGNQPQQPATQAPQQTDVPAPSNVPATDVPTDVPLMTDIPQPTVEPPVIPTEEPPPDETE